MRGKPDHELVVDLLRDVGVGRLAYYDGCICSHFSVRGVNVSISCGKGGARGIWVWSNNSDYYDFDLKKLDEKQLRPIADELERQINGADNRGSIKAYIEAKE